METYGITPFELERKISQTPVGSRQQQLNDDSTTIDGYDQVGAKAGPHDSNDGKAATSPFCTKKEVLEPNPTAVPTALDQPSGSSPFANTSKRKGDSSHVTALSLKSMRSSTNSDKGSGEEALRELRNQGN
jgi:hypothetical protein